MTAKKINAKDFLINNGIIVVLLLLAVFTAIKQPTFFSRGNLINIALNVAPRFIIACGVSGAMQHVSGIMGSKYIVAINKDEAASIFDIADVGIVGDVKEILPLLIEEIKARK